MGYVAGIIDGEGCISVGSRGTRGDFEARVTIANTNQELLEYIQSLVGGKLYSQDTRVGWKRAYHLSWSGYDAIELCRITIPYLFLKRAQAGIILEYPIHPRGTRLSQEEKLRQTLAFIQLRDLNKKGAVEDVQLDQPSAAIAFGIKKGK